MTGAAARGSGEQPCERRRPHVVAFAGDSFYVRSLRNSLLLGLATVAATSVLGFAIAFLLVRYDFPGRNLFSYLTLIPIISPPLVGVLGFTFIMGRAGTVNVLLMDYLGLTAPGCPGGTPSTRSTR